MTTFRRQQAILDLLDSRNEVTIAMLAERLDVSPNTIRNDLTALDGKGKLTRVRGGAVARTPGDAPGPARIPAALETIAGSAVHLVRDGDTIVLDAGEAALGLARALRDKKNLTVITTGIAHAQCLAEVGGNTVVLASNVIEADGSCTVGSLCPTIPRKFHASHFFCSGEAIDLETGISARNLERGTMNARLKELASRTVVLAVPDAVSRVGGVGFAGLDEIDTIIALRGTLGDRLEDIRSAARITIVLASSDEDDEIIEPSEKGENRAFRIGFGNLSDEFTFSKQVRASLEKAAGRRSDVELLVKDNELSRETTLSNMQAFVESEVDLVIEYQLDASAGNIIMDAFNRAGIPVIAVDIPMPGATYFGADNYRAGHMAGENLGHWINREWNGRFDYLLRLSIERAGSLGSARIQGLREGLFSVTGSMPDDRIVTLNNMLYGEAVRSAVRNILPTIPAESRIAVIGMNDQAVIDALEVFVEEGRRDLVVGVGQNADAAGLAKIAEADFPFIGSTRYAPEEYGEEILDLALKILHGEAVPPAIHQSHIFIDAKNLEEYYGGAP